MLKKFLSISNLFVLFFVLWWNYYSNSGKIGNKTIGEISNLFTNLFTPASYAFSIWGIIYFLLLASSLYLLKISFTNKEDTILYSTAPFIIIANLLNGLWIWFWLNLEILSSVLVMLSILIILISTVINLRVRIGDKSLKVRFFIWWPINIYLGWISVATVANIAAYLTFIRWDFIFENYIWACIMLFVMGTLSILLLYKKNMPEFTAVAIWALVAIAVKNWSTESLVAKTALTIAILLFFEVLRIALKKNKKSTSQVKEKK